ncbi:hypothetical protein L1887_56887 [Cichorium endivia]|nr:hypothetical protein L1887_56887 [Cichorium endivia]
MLPLHHRTTRRVFAERDVAHDLRLFEHDTTLRTHRLVVGVVDGRRATICALHRGEPGFDEVKGKVSFVDVHPLGSKASVVVPAEWIVDGGEKKRQAAMVICACRARVRCWISAAERGGQGAAQQLSSLAVQQFRPTCPDRPAYPPPLFRKKKQRTESCVRSLVRFHSAARASATKPCMPPRKAAPVAAHKHTPHSQSR